MEAAAHLSRAHGQEPLWSRLERQKGILHATNPAAPVDLLSQSAPLRLAPSEAEVLQRFAAARGTASASQSPTLRVLLYEALVAAGESGEVGQAGRRALVELGLLPELLTDILPDVRAWMDDKNVRLDTTRFLYVGHATHAIVPLFQMLAALGLDRAQVNAAQYSGLESAHDAIEAVIRSMHLARGHIEDPFGEESLDSVSFSPPNGELRRQTRLARMSGQTLLVDKAGSLIARERRKKGGLCPVDERGQRRLLLHNSDDARALGPHIHDHFVTDVRNSLFKLLEARYIGEATALAAARIVREQWSMPIGGTTVRVLGYGLIGRSLVRALRRLGMPAERIEVIEPDAKRRHQASAVCRAVATIEPDDDERTVVFNATSANSLGPSNVAAMAETTMVFNMASRGRGVDVESITHADRLTRLRMAGESLTGENPIQPRQDHSTRWRHMSSDDRVCNLQQEDGSVRAVCLINAARLNPGEPLCAYPINLLEAPWPDLFATATSMAVLMGILAATAQTEPGLQSTPRRLERRIIRQLYDRGARDLRPLDLPKTTSYNASDQHLAQVDLHSFAITKFPGGYGYRPFWEE